MPARMNPENPALVSERTPVRFLWPQDRKERGPLGTLCLNRLRGDGVERVGDLTMRTAGDLRDIRHFGERCVAEVRRRLAAHGLALKGDPEADRG